MGIQKVEVTKAVFDLAAFNEITVGKQIDFNKVESTDEALERLANDEARLVSIINKGLLAEAIAQARKDEDGWRKYTDEGALNGAYDGIPADPKKVNNIVLSIAKNVYGYKKDMHADKEQNRILKRDIKEKAKDFIKTNDTIREGLKVNAAFSDTDDDENEVSEVEE